MNDLVLQCRNSLVLLDYVSLCSIVEFTFCVRLNEYQRNINLSFRECFLMLSNEYVRSRSFLAPINLQLAQVRRYPKLKKCAVHLSTGGGNLLFFIVSALWQLPYFTGFFQCISSGLYKSPMSLVPLSKTFLPRL